MNAKMKLFKEIKNSALKWFATFLTVVTFSACLLPETIYALAANSTVLKTGIIGQETQFDKKFREGRDFIDKEEWAKAIVKFSDIVTYPKNKSTDAALYWLALCYKKQKQFKETDTTLDRLLKEFPDSSWADDAEVMKIEIALTLGRAVGTTYTVSEPNFTYSAVIPKNAAQGTATVTMPKSFEELKLGEVYVTAERTPLDRQDEIKIAAFQSLLSADPKRAIEILGEILKSDSKATETLKQETLRVLRNPRFLRTQTNFNFFASGISKQFMPLLKETLVKGFQNESNIKIRKEIIYALASIGDDQSVEYLSQLYVSQDDKEIKKAIINSFSSSPQQLFFSGSGAGSTVNSIRKIEFDKLLEIVRAEKDTELRRLAFSALQRFGNGSATEQIIETFVQMFDAESDEEFKISIIRALTGSKQNQASRKLLDIAKNDKSDKLKLEAIYALRTSKSPEVLRFLEDLIK